MKTSILAFFLLIFFSACRKDPFIRPAPAPFLHYYGTNGDETGRMVKTVGDSDIVVCGFGAGPNGANDFFLLKTDQLGIQRWIKYYGGAGDETCWSFALAPDGGYVIGGYSNSFGAGGDDFVLIKTDADGNQQWIKTYGTSNNEQGINIRPANNGYFICGIANSGNDENAWMIRLDQNGDSLWSFNWGGNGNDGAMFSCDGANGSHVITGYTNSNTSGGTNGFLLILSDSGSVIAQYEFGTPEYDEPHTVTPAIDGDGWVVCGHYGATPMIVSHNIFLVKIGASGAQQWRYTYGGTEHDGGEGLAVFGNTYAIVARSNSRPGTSEDVYFVRVNENGTLREERWLGTAGNDAGYGITSDRGSLILTGYAAGPMGGKDIYLERLRKCE
jgi:hypothetical protein